MEKRGNPARFDEDQKEGNKEDTITSTKPLTSEGEIGVDGIHCQQQQQHRKSIINSPHHHHHQQDKTSLSTLHLTTEATAAATAALASPPKCRSLSIRSNSLDDVLNIRRRRTFKRSDSGVSSDSSEPSLPPSNLLLATHRLHTPSGESMATRMMNHGGQVAIAKRNCCSLTSEEEEDEEEEETYLAAPICHYEHSAEDDYDQGRGRRHSRRASNSSSAAGAAVDREAMEAERSLYQTQYNDLNERNRNLAHKVLYMEEVVFDLRSEQEKLIKRFADQETVYRRRIEAYQAEVEMLKESLEQCDDRLADARRREAEANQQRTRACQEITELRAQLSTQELELTSLQDTRLELQRVQHAYQKAISRIEALNSEKANAITALEQEHAEQRAARDEQIGALNEKVAQLGHQLAKSIETIQDLQQRKLCLTCKRLLAHCDDDEHIVEKVSEVDEVGNNAANSYRKKSLTDECCSTTMRVATIGGGVGGGGDGGDDHEEAAAATLSMPNNTTTVAAPCSGSNVRQSIVTVPSSTASPASLSSALASPITSSPRSSLNNAEIVETSNSLNTTTGRSKPMRLRRQAPTDSNTPPKEGFYCDNMHEDLSCTIANVDSSLSTFESVYPNGLSLKEEIDSNNNKCLLANEQRTTTSKAATTATMQMAAGTVTAEDATDENGADDCRRGNCNNNNNNNKSLSKDVVELGDDIATKIESCGDRSLPATISASTANTGLAEEELFPSLPDVMLRKLCLLGENTCTLENLTQEEIDSKFHTLSLGFKTDKFTLEQRVRLYRHQRDVAETDANNELACLTDQVKELKRRLFGFDSKFLNYNSHTSLYQMRELKEMLDEIEQQAKVIKAVARKIGSRAELYGAVKQEEKLSTAFDVIMLHLDNLKRSNERDSRELEELRKMLNDSRNDSVGGPMFMNSNGSEPGGVGHRRTIRSISTTMTSKINLIRVRRASVASIDIVDPSKELNNRLLQNQLGANATTTTTTTQTFHRPMMRQATIDNLSSLIGQAKAAACAAANFSNNGLGSINVRHGSSGSSPSLTPTRYKSATTRRLSVPAADLRNRTKLMQMLNANPKMEITEEEAGGRDSNDKESKSQTEPEETALDSAAPNEMLNADDKGRRLTITPVVQSEETELLTGRRGSQESCAGSEANYDEIEDDSFDPRAQWKANPDGPLSAIYGKRRSNEDIFYRELIDRLAPLEALQSAHRSPLNLLKRSTNRLFRFIFHTILISFVASLFHLANSQSKAAVTSVIQFANTNANKIRFTFSVALGVLSLLILFWSLFLPMIAD